MRGRFFFVPARSRTGDRAGSRATVIENMTIFNVTPRKQKQLEERMERLGILEKDLVEKFVKGSGKGGQKLNKTSSCVYLLHKPSKIEVKCQRERSQAMNRFLARRELCDRLEERIQGEKNRRQQERAPNHWPSRPQQRAPVLPLATWVRPNLRLEI